MVRVTFEAETAEELQDLLRKFVGITESRGDGQIANPAKKPDSSDDGDEPWTSEEINLLWSRVNDPTRYVLGVISDAGEDNEYTKSRDDLFEKLEKYKVNVPKGTGFGGALSSYGFATRALGYRNRKERLYTLDDRGYSMKPEYAILIRPLFEKWLKERNTKQNKVSEEK